MNVYHVTTPAKLARYEATGGILPPVRFWRFKSSAFAWARKTRRTIVLELDEPSVAYPLPDHQPPRHAWWSPEMVRTWRALSAEAEAVS